MFQRPCEVGSGRTFSSRALPEGQARGTGGVDTPGYPDTYLVYFIVDNCMLYMKTCALKVPIIMIDVKN